MTVRPAGRKQPFAPSLPFARTGRIQCRIRMYFAYSLLLGLALVVALPWWLFQMARSHKYRSGLAERFGRVPDRVKRSQSGALVIWVHAVSVGEVLAVSGLIERLRESFSRHRIVISTTTATGQKLARDRFGEKNVFYFPMDLGFAIRPYLRVLRPRLVIVAETEFWPNFLRTGKGKWGTRRGGELARLGPLFPSLSAVQVSAGKGAGECGPVSRAVRCGSRPAD